VKENVLHYAGEYAWKLFEEQLNKADLYKVEEQARGVSGARDGPVLVRRFAVWRAGRDKSTARRVTWEFEASPEAAHAVDRGTLSCDCSDPIALKMECRHCIQVRRFLQQPVHLRHHTLKPRWNMETEYSDVLEFPPGAAQPPDEVPAAPEATQASDLSQPDLSGLSPHLCGRAAAGNASRPAATRKTAPRNL
jgi:hypothetical protein